MVFEPWMAYALLAMIGFTFMSILLKRSVSSLEPSLVLFYLFLFATLWYGGHLLITQTFMMPQLHTFLFIAAAALFSYVANLFHMKAYASVHNIGYVDALVSIRILVVSLIAVLLFDASLGIRHMIAILLVIVGIALLSIDGGKKHAV